MNTLTIIALITFYAHKYNIAPAVAVAVAEQESQLDPNAVGLLNEQGVFQLRPEFFKNYTIKELRNPETNIKLGVQYLAKLKKSCVHKGDVEFLVCWNYGSSNARHVHHPELFPYVKEVKRRIAAKGE
jgi:soluble lytic murein transglycosylase-like protein